MSIVLQVRSGPETTTRILGIPVDSMNLEEVADVMIGWAQGDLPHQVVTVNPEFVMIAQTNKKFRDVLCEASLRIPDGIGIVWAARLLGNPIKGRVAGVDAMHAFARKAASKGLRIFMLGAAPGVAERAASILQDLYNGLTIVGTYAGSPRSEDEEDICAQIERARPDALFVAFGAPEQDLWIARTANRLRIPVAMGVGGSFDFIAGVAKRAPAWMQRRGLEWFFRLLHEPWRWRRMLRLPRFLVAVVCRRDVASIPM